MLLIKQPHCLSGENDVFFPITTGFLFVLLWAGVVPLGYGEGQALIPLKILPLVRDHNRASLGCGRVYLSCFTGWRIIELAPSDTSRLFNKSPVLQRDNERERNLWGNVYVWHCQKPQLAPASDGNRDNDSTQKDAKKCFPTALSACFNLFLHHFHSRLTLRNMKVNFAPVEGETRIISGKETLLIVTPGLSYPSVLPS